MYVTRIFLFTRICKIQTQHFAKSYRNINTIVFSFQCLFAFKIFRESPHTTVCEMDNTDNKILLKKNLKFLEIKDNLEISFD